MIQVHPWNNIIRTDFFMKTLASLQMVHRKVYKKFNNNKTIAKIYSQGHPINFNEDTILSYTHPWAPTTTEMRTPPYLITTPGSPI